jgi:hypothetical protein
MSISYTPSIRIDHIVGIDTPVCEVKCKMERNYPITTGYVNYETSNDLENTNSFLYLKVNLILDQKTFQVTFNNIKYKLYEIRIGPAKHVHVMTDSQPDSQDHPIYEISIIHNNHENPSAGQLIIYIPIQQMENSNTDWVDRAVELSKTKTTDKSGTIITYANAASIQLNLNNIIKLNNPFFHYTDHQQINHNIIMQNNNDNNIINISEKTLNTLKNIIIEKSTLTLNGIINPSMAYNKTGMFSLGFTLGGSLSQMCSANEGFANLNQVSSYYGSDVFDNVWPYDKQSRLVILLVFLCGILWYIMNK